MSYDICVLEMKNIAMQACMHLQKIKCEGYLTHLLVYIKRVVPNNRCLYFEMQRDWLVLIK